MLLISQAVQAGAIKLKTVPYDKEAIMEVGNFDIHLDGMGLLQFLREVGAELKSLGTAGKTLEEFDAFEEALLAGNEVRVKQYKSVYRFTKVYLAESLHAGDVRIFDVQNKSFVTALKAKKFKNDEGSGYKFISKDSGETVYSYLTSYSAETSF